MKRRRETYTFDGPGNDTLVITSDGDFIIRTAWIEVECFGKWVPIDSIGIDEEESMELPMDKRRVMRRERAITKSEALVWFQEHVMPPELIP